MWIHSFCVESHFLDYRKRQARRNSTARCSSSRSLPYYCLQLFIKLSEEIFLLTRRQWPFSASVEGYVTVATPCTTVKYASYSHEHVTDQATFPPPSPATLGCRDSSARCVLNGLIEVYLNFSPMQSMRATSCSSSSRTRSYTRIDIETREETSTGLRTTRKGAQYFTSRSGYGTPGDATPSRL